MGGVLSVGQGLTELDLWDRLLIRGIESAGLIEGEDALGRSASRDSTPIRRL